MIGHQKQQEFFEKNIKQGQLAHAYLFCGQEQIGKKTFAIELARKLIGQDIEKGNHPDFLFVRSGEESAEDSYNNGISYNSSLPDLENGRELKDAKEIEISQARKIINFLSVKPYLGECKLVIIDNAHKLTIQSQNCLLKTLEEPKGRKILILVTSQPDSLLPTIISRCQTVKFCPVLTKEIEKYLSEKGCPLKKSADLAGIAYNRPGVAINYFLYPEKLEEEKKAIEDVVSIAESTLAEKFAFTKNLKEDGADIKKVFLVLQKYLRYLMCKEKNFCSIDGEFFFGNAGKTKKYPPDKLADILRFMDMLYGKISFSNTSPKLALEALLLELA